jgi:hypothetical protein
VPITSIGHMESNERNIKDYFRFLTTEYRLKPLSNFCCFMILEMKKETTRMDNF